MNYSALRGWLRDTLATIDGLEAYDRPPGSVVVPCAFPQRIVTNPRTAFGDVEQANVEVTLLVSRGDEDSAWDLIDGYVTRGDSQCVIDALETTTPDGFDTLSVISWEAGVAEVNSIDYISIVLTCEVIG